MLKTAVGVQDFQHLMTLQDRYMMTFDEESGQKAVIATTRYMPKRRDEILKGGSLFWIFKRKIQCRQEILDLQLLEDEQTKTRCYIFLNPQIIQTMAQPKKPIQGWRYLEDAAAPKDRGPIRIGEAGDEMPAHMVEELHTLGLL